MRMLGCCCSPKGSRDVIRQDNLVWILHASQENARKGKQSANLLAHCRNYLSSMDGIYLLVFMLVAEERRQ